MIRYTDEKSTAFAQLRLHPYPPLMAVNDLLTSGQADAATFKLIAWMQALKHLKYLRLVLGGYADPVISNRENMPTRFFLIGDPNPRGFTLTKF